MIPVVVRRWAEVDVRFVQEFAATVDRIAALPDQFPEVSTRVRRALLHHFPYAIYFVRREDVSIVIAALHQRRRPGGWKSRLKLEEAGLTPHAPDGAA